EHVLARNLRTAATEHLEGGVGSEGSLVDPRHLPISPVIFRRRREPRLRFAPEGERGVGLGEQPELEAPYLRGTRLTLQVRVDGGKHRQRRSPRARHPLEREERTGSR